MTSVLEINVGVRECDELLRVHRPIHTSRPIQSADAVSNRSTGGNRSIGAHSTTCPQCFRVDVRQLGSSSQLQSKITSERLALMHVDHTYDVQHICTTWKSLSTPSPPCWDYGVCALKLCHLLFGTNATKDEEACLSFRCAVISTNSQCPCHHVARPHYEHTLQPSQLQ